MTDNLPTYDETTDLVVIVFKYFRLILSNQQTYICKVGYDNYINKMNDKSRKLLDDSFNVELKSHYLSEDIFCESGHLDKLTFEEVVQACDDELLMNYDDSSDSGRVMIHKEDYQLIMHRDNLFYHHFDYKIETMDKLDIVCVDGNEMRKDIDELNDVVNRQDRDIETLSDRVGNLEKENSELVKKLKKLEDLDNVVRLDRSPYMNLLSYSNLSSKILFYTSSAPHMYLKKEDVYLHHVSCNQFTGSLHLPLDKIDNHHLKSISLVINDRCNSYINVESNNYYDSFYILLLQLTHIAKSGKPYTYMTDIYFCYFANHSSTVHENVVPQHYTSLLPHIKKFSKDYKHITIRIKNLPEDKIINSFRKCGSTTTYTACDISSILSLLNWTDKMI